VRRLLHAVSLADASPAPAWSRVAADAGFSDQSHLTNEFRLLTGLTPVRLHAERSGQWLGDVISSRAG
jgi:AraC-like DNA-binding protein